MRVKNGVAPAYANIGYLEYLPQDYDDKNKTILTAGTVTMRAWRTDPIALNEGVNAITVVADASATTYALMGSASDDASPGALSIGWSKIEGPGSVVFDAPSSPQTTATFSALGTYTLRLSAGDGAQAVSDDVVLVLSAPAARGSSRWRS